MTYLEDAQERASRHRSRWNLLLIPAVLLPLVALAWGFTALLAMVHQRRYPSQHLVDSSGLATVLTVIGAILAAMPVALIIGNGLVWLVGPARRTLQSEAQALPGTDFVTAQQKLIRAAVIVVPICLVIAVVGALLPW